MWCRTRFSSHIDAHTRCVPTVAAHAVTDAHRAPAFRYIFSHCNRVRPLSSAMLVAVCRAACSHTPAPLQTAAACAASLAAVSASYNSLQRIRDVIAHVKQYGWRRSLEVLHSQVFAAATACGNCVACGTAGRWCAAAADAAAVAGAAVACAVCCRHLCMYSLRATEIA